MPDSEPPAGKPVRKRRRWKRKTALVLFVLLVAGLFLLNGPGWRWIAKRVADHYLPDLGLAGTVEFGGTLSDGEILLKGVNLHGEGAVRQVQLDQVILRYHPSRVIHGEIDAVKIDGLHAELDLDRPFPASKPKENQPATDLSKLAETLRNLRQRIVPVNAEISDLQVRINRGTRPVFRLASMDLKHPAGDERFSLKLGELEFPNGQTLPAQETALVWGRERIELERALLMPGVAVESLTAALPPSGDLTYDGSIRVNDGRLTVKGSLEEAHVRLVGGTLVAQPVAALFRVEIPADGTLEMFEVDATGLKGGIRTLDGTVRAGLRGLSYREWQVPVLRLDGALKGTNLDLTANAEALGSPLKITATSSVTRDGGLKFQHAEADLTVADAAAVLTELRDTRMPAVKNPGPVPASSLTAHVIAGFTAGKIARADIHTLLTPHNAAELSPLDLTAVWVPQKPVEAGLVIEAATIHATVDPAARTYQGSASFNDFTPDRLHGWLAAFGVNVPPEMSLRGTWEGGGSFRTARPQGPCGDRGLHLGKGRRRPGDGGR